MQNTLSDEIERNIETFREQLGYLFKPLSESNASYIVEEHLRQLARSIAEKTVEAVRVEERCMFVPDGEYHDCILTCDGTVQNCAKCKEDICSNPDCPLGKGHDPRNRSFNQAVNEQNDKASAWLGKE